MKRTKTLQLELCSLINRVCEHYCSAHKSDQAWEGIFNLFKMLKMVFEEVSIENGQYIHTIKNHTELGKSWVCIITHKGVTVKFNVQALWTDPYANNGIDYRIHLNDGSNKICVGDPIMTHHTHAMIPNLVYYND